MYRSFEDLQLLLDIKYHQYHQAVFIIDDPVSVPHQFQLKEDIEISAFFAATIAWGQRKTIISNANKLMSLMEYKPFDFIINSGSQDLKKFEKFVHRTFNGIDCLFFIESLRNIYLNHGGLESVFTNIYTHTHSIKSCISGFRKIFFEIPHLSRTGKHVSNVDANASAKRLNMFLRWMVRYDSGIVDFGLWKNIPVSALLIPLDVHSGTIARKLGLLSRKQDDWKAVEELTIQLRNFDPEDPVKYDFALFGMGAYEGKIL